MKQSHVFFILELNPVSIARRNARTKIVGFSTALPFRLPGSTLMCVFCCESFPETPLFRQYMADEHRGFNPKLAFVHLSHGYPEVDITASLRI